MQALLQFFEYIISYSKNTGEAVKNNVAVWFYVSYATFRIDNCRTRRRSGCVHFLVDPGNVHDPALCLTKKIA